MSGTTAPAYHAEQLENRKALSLCTKIHGVVHTKYKVDVVARFSHRHFVKVGDTSSHTLSEPRPRLKIARRRSGAARKGCERSNE